MKIFEEKINNYKQEIDSKLLGTYPSGPTSLNKPINYVLGLGGKRMRPILLLMSYQLFDNNRAIFVLPKVLD